MSKHITKKNLIKRGVYLYVFNPGYPLRVYKGNVYVEHYSMCQVYFFKSNEKKPYIVNCSKEKGTFLRNNFWLRELDKEKALDIYYQHIKELIDKKVNQIDSYKRTYAFFTKYDMESHIKEN